MIELTCQSCGAKVGVQSFVAAAQQPCPRCRQLLMGPLAAAARGSGSSAALWLGMLAGMLAGIAFVAAVAHAGRVIPPNVQCAVLGALAGVLLAPVIAISSFLSMLTLPFSLEGILGDSIWTRLAKANNERRLGPLFMPILVLVVMPMAVCALGGSQMRSIDSSMVIVAGLGAAMLGLVLGGVCGVLLDNRRGQE